jgi:hypothetical protein
VSDYRWVDLRDHRTSSTNFQHHFGLLDDQYSQKPAFAAYRRLGAELARRNPVRSRRLSLALRVNYRHHRGRDGRSCARSRVKGRLAGSGTRRVRYADFLLGGRDFGRDRVRPFAIVIRIGHIARERVYKLVARAKLDDRRVAVRTRHFRVCRS